MFNISCFTTLHKIQVSSINPTSSKLLKSFATNSFQFPHFFLLLKYFWNNILLLKLSAHLTAFWIEFFKHFSFENTDKNRKFMDFRRGFKQFRFSSNQWKLLPGGCSTTFITCLSPISAWHLFRKLFIRWNLRRTKSQSSFQSRQGLIIIYHSFNPIFASSHYSLDLKELKKKFKQLIVL